MLINLTELENNYLWEHKVSKVPGFKSIISITTFYMNKGTHYIEFGNRIKRESFYKRGECHGISKAWRDGILIYSLPYKNGKIHGKTYINRNSFPETAVYKYGKKHGIERSYYLTGKLMRTVSYKNGKMDGLYKHYYENGKIQRIVQMKNGKEHGKYEIYNEKGQLEYSKRALK